MVNDLKDIVIITLGGLSSALGILFTAAVYRKKNAAETFEKTAAGKKNEADAFKITIETTMSVGELYKREFKELRLEFDTLKKDYNNTIALLKMKSIVQAHFTNYKPSPCVNTFFHSPSWPCCPHS